MKFSIIKTYLEVINFKKTRIIYVLALQISLSIFELFSVLVLFNFVSLLTEQSEVLSENKLMPEILMLGSLSLVAYMFKPFIYYHIMYRIFDHIFSCWELLNYNILLRFFNTQNKFQPESGQNEREAVLSTETTTVVTSFIIPITTAFAEIIVITSLSLFLFVVNPIATLIAILCCSIVFAVVNSITRPAIRRLGLLRSVEEVKRINLINNVISNRDELVFFDQGDHLFNKLEESLISIKSSWTKHLALGLVPKASMEFAAIISAALSVGYALIFSGMTIDETIAFAVATGLVVMRVVPAANKIILGYQYANFNLPSAQRITRSFVGHDDDDKISEVSTAPASLELKGLHNREKRLADFIVERPGIYAITGRSGAGKSVFLKSLLGLVNSRFESRRISSSEGRSKVAYVSQKPQLWVGTFRENLTLTNSEKENLNCWIERLGLQEAIENLPDGLDTKVNPEVEQLSGGQIARFTFLRTILREPEILILDEFTANLDAKSKQIILQICSEISAKTIIVIATHDTATLKICEKKFDLELGWT